LVIHVAKLFPKNDCSSFDAYGRIFSGTLRPGDEVRRGGGCGGRVEMKGAESEGDGVKKWETQAWEGTEERDRKPGGEGLGECLGQGSQ
jgi:hypothetical protein